MKRIVLSLFLSVLNVVFLSAASRDVTVGVAWTGEKLNSRIKACIEAAGGRCVELGQVRLNSLEYEGSALDSTCIAPSGMLAPEMAARVKKYCSGGFKPKVSNVREVLSGIDAVVLTGGEDISPSLYDSPVPEANRGEEFNATRDVSDFILARYCLDNDLPLIGICRGMQMIGVTSGSAMIQHIPDTAGVHRRQHSSQSRSRHDIVIEEGTLAHRLFGRTVLQELTSTHHQAVLPVDGTSLLRSGHYEYGGLDITEIIERPDKNFVIGMQGHPEWAYSKYGTEEDRFICERLFGGLCKAARAVKGCYSIADGVAVFEPDAYDASAHSPSPIFLEQFHSGAAVPADWKLTPVFSGGKGHRKVTFDVGDADLYGAGEVLGDLRRNDDVQFFWNTDNPTYMLDGGKRLYQTHPWLLGLRKDGTAFGIIADNTWKSKLSTKGKVCFESEGPAFRVVVIEKDNPEDVLRTLADLTGRMELPPLWSLGYQQCRYSYFPDSRVREIADRLRAGRIPCDVLWMDIHYMQDYKIFTFNKERFPDPEGLNSYLHANGFKSVYMIDPGVKAERGYALDDELMSNAYAVRTKKGEAYVGPVWPGDCHFPDFTNPGVCRWWAGQYKDFMAKGVDGVWNDMNDPSVFVDFGGTMPATNLHRGGCAYPSGPHLRYHNVYGYFMVKASREGIMAANPDKRPFVLSRSNFLGGQRYAATWTGDNFSDYSQMKAAVPMTLNMGLSSQAFCGPDIGGFMRDCTPDLLRHWTASGVYFPFVRNHSNLDSVDQEPFAFDSVTEDICRTAIERRYRLLPYIYTLFEEASRTGMPVMRPVFMADARDNDLRSEQQAFLLGKDLLVIPRWSENPSLPKGDWDLFTLEDDGADDGYQSWLALRPGAAIPVTGVVQSTVDYSTDSLTVLVNPDACGKACGTLYEDAGDGYGYKDGEYARYDLTAVSEGGRLTLTVKRSDGRLPQRERKLRIGLVCDGKTVYSDWTSSSSVSVGNLENECMQLDRSGLDPIRLTDGSVSTRQTKWELIKSNIVPKKK